MRLPLRKERMGKKEKGFPRGGIIPEFNFFPIRIFCVHLRPIFYFWR